VTTNWTTVRFDHTAVTGTCSSCHNGTTATGKSAKHISSTNNCDSCHVTTLWTTVHVDHTAVIGTCTSCHNGTTASGKPLTHITTNAQCDTCHSTIAWLPATFDHSGVIGSCSTCHNGTSATGKTPTHFVTTVQCDSCHTTVAWTPIRFTHSSPDFPGTHKAAVTCLSCHTGNSQTATWTSAAYKPDCAGCHAARFVPDSHIKTSSPATVRYTVSELRDCAGSCHLYTDNTFTTIRTSRTGHHRSSSIGW
jgi:hypothetical protein